MYEVIQSNEIQELAINIQGCYQTNQLRASKAKAYGETILKKIQQEGMNPANDKICQTYLSNCSKAKKQMQAIRKPYTTKLDSIKKEFTTQENLLDSEGSCAEQIQALRNEYAKQLCIKAELEKQNKEQEARNIQQQATLSPEEKIQSLVDLEITAQQAEQPEVRESIKISIQHPYAYELIFAFWYERIGKEMPIEEAMKKTLSQMKNFCEKECQKTGEKIESNYLNYEKVITAINRK